MSVPADMPRVRHHLTEHAALDTIPLRVGVVPSGKKVYLENIEQDDAGTDQQTFTQKRQGRKHILADIWTEQSGGQCYARWRVVTAEPKVVGDDPPVLTVLPIDRSTARTAADLSSYLKNEREKSNKDWLTPSYVAQVLHPLVITGALQNQSDLADHIMEYGMRESNKEKKEILADNARIKSIADEAITHLSLFEQKYADATARAEQAEENERSALEKLAIAKANANSVSASFAIDNQPGELALPAKAVTRPWRSKTGSTYQNVGVEAYVKEVNRYNDNIRLTYIDENGRTKTIQDFAFKGFVAEVHDYLVAHKEQRAIFLITKKPDGPSMLAADTMRLPQYRHLWS